MAAPDPQTLVITLNAPTPYFLELLTHQTGKPLHQASVEEFGERLHQARQHGDERRLHAGELRAERQDRAEEEPELLRRRQRQDRRRCNWIPFEDRSACLRRFEAGEVPICSDVPAEQMAYMKEKLPNSLRIAPYLGTYYLPVKVDEGEVRRPAGAPGDLDADRPRLHRRRGLAGDDAAGLFAGAAGHRQLRREPARARLRRRWTCSTARTRRSSSSQEAGVDPGDARDPAQLQLVGEPPQHHGGGGGQAVERRHQVDAERDGGDRTTSTTCARAATSTSRAPAGSATTPTRRTSST